MIWGIDLGVRSYYAVGLPEHSGEEHIFAKRVLTKGKSRYLELRDLRMSLNEIVTTDDVLVVEEPPMAGPMNKRTFGQLSMTAGVILSATSAQGYFVPVASWKRTVIGNGSASKGDVDEWLHAHHPELHRQAQGDQNFMDAACIALYGEWATVAGRNLGAGDLAGPP